MRRILALALLVVTAALMTTACQRPGPPAGEARAHLDGDDSLEAAGADEAFAAIGDDARVREGTRLRAVAGEPVIELADGVTITLRKGSRVIVGDPVLIARGAVLVDAPRAFDLATPIGRVTVDGVARVEQSLASSVRTYEGWARVSSAGRTLDVDARRQASVPARGLVPKRAAPTTWRRSDPWDLRYLGLVIDLTDQLEAQGRGFAMQSGASPLDVVDLLPGLERGAFAATATSRSAGDALVGGAIATASSRPLRQVFGMRDDGAAWGLVTVEEVRGDPRRVVELVRAAIASWSSRRAAFALAERSRGVPASPAASPPSTAPAPGAGAAPTATSPAPPKTTTPTTSPTSPTTQPPSPIPTLPPGPVDTTIPPIVDGIGGLIGGVIGGAAGGAGASAPTIGG